jgi:uncharacterized membrane protein YkvA (DUF1232 family)
MAEHRQRGFRLRDEEDDDRDDEEILPSGRRIQAPRLRRGPRAEPVAESGRDSVMALVRDIPNFGRLLWGLARDPRVSRADKGIVVAALAYVALPFDFLPDTIPLIGEIDDVYVIMLALSRLVNNAGMEVLLDHWQGEMSSLERALAGLDKASSFLPEPIRRVLGKRFG